MDKASSSYRERSKHDKRSVKRFASPDISKMYILSVPSPNIPGKTTEFYFATALRRDEALKRYPNARSINPKK